MERGKIIKQLRDHVFACSISGLSELPTCLAVGAAADLLEADAKAEGFPASEVVEMADGSPCYSHGFRKWWESNYGVDNPAAWERNPWVWVYEFRRIDKP